MTDKKIGKFLESDFLPAKRGGDHEKNSSGVQDAF